LIKKIELRGPNQFDGSWVDLIFTLENTDGQSCNHYVSIPTTAERSFMFGKKKSLREYNNLDSFLHSVGYKLEYSSAMSQIVALFDDYDQTFVGKTLSARLGYLGNRAKYVGKTDAGAQYVLVDKNDKVIDDNSFSGIDAAKAYAEQNSIKLNGFIKCLDFIPAETAAVATLSAVSDLPF